MSNLSGFIQRLELVLSTQGLKMASLHRSLGLAYSTMGRWRSGAAPHKATVSLVAATLGVNDEWLQHGTGPMESEKPSPDVLLIECPDESALVQKEIALRLEAYLTSPSEAAKAVLRARLEEFFNAVEGGAA